VQNSVLNLKSDRGRASQSEDIVTFHSRQFTREVQSGLSKRWGEREATRNDQVFDLAVTNHRLNRNDVGRESRRPIPIREPLFQDEFLGRATSSQYFIHLIGVLYPERVSTTGPRSWFENCGKWKVNTDIASANVREYWHGNSPPLKRCSLFQLIGK
jgi:hypothetical protein